MEGKRGCGVECDRGRLPWLRLWYSGSSRNSFNRPLPKVAYAFNGSSAVVTSPASFDWATLLTGRSGSSRSCTSDITFSFTTISTGPSRMGRLDVGIISTVAIVTVGFVSDPCERWKRTEESVERSAPTGWGAGMSGVFIAQAGGCSSSFQRLGFAAGWITRRREYDVTNQGRMFLSIHGITCSCNSSRRVPCALRSTPHLCTPPRRIASAPLPVFGSHCWPLARAAATRLDIGLPVRLVGSQKDCKLSSTVWVSSSALLSIDKRCGGGRILTRPRCDAAGRSRIAYPKWKPLAGEEDGGICGLQPLRHELS